MKLGWVTTIPGVDYSVISKHFWDYIGLNHIDTLVINNQTLEICPDNVITLTDQVSNLELLRYKVGLDPFVVPEVGIKWLRGCQKITVDPNFNRWGTYQIIARGQYGSTSD